MKDDIEATRKMMGGHLKLTQQLISEGVSMPTSEAPEKLYYIQDTRGYTGNSVVWWKPDGKGYTSDLDQAWKVSRDKAQQMHRSRGTDLPWLCVEIDAQAQRHFDMQRLRGMRGFSEATDESRT